MIDAHAEIPMMQPMLEAWALPQLQQALKRGFGLQDFRPGQQEVVSAVLEGRNAVAVMPTGAGKSLCFQLPAVLLPGVTVVVSPLIALMQDQVAALDARGIPATFINSSLGELERADRLRNLKGGAYKLVYVAPERFRSAYFLEALAQVQVSLLAVDEAHCISQWGHDFRPDYAALGQVRKRLRPPRTVALTATATPEVRDDIVKSLLMKEPQVFVAGFDRPNLFLEVVRVAGDEQKQAACAQLLEEGGSGIVYCSTRRSAEALCAFLKRRGRTVVLYHAGMDDSSRSKAQQAFMESKDAVAVATNAFGMGIDKPDLRFVAHANIPRAVEAYYQEIGRAGRDGADAKAVLLFNHSDVYTQERLIAATHPSEAVLADVWAAVVAEDGYTRGVATLAAQIGASEFEVSAALRVLERAGKLSRTERERSRPRVVVRPGRDTADLEPDPGLVLAALGSAGQSERELDLPLLARQAGLSQERTRRALGALEAKGHLTVRRPFAGRAVRALERVPFRELGVDLVNVRAQERRALLLLRRMTDYAYTQGCRRAFLLRYFGEAHVPARCDSCDVCAGSTVRSRALGAAGTGPAAPPAHNELAALELRRWRRELARDLELPPFILFNDAALNALASALPVDRASFLAVHGMGEARWERFGPKIVEICQLARAAAS